MSARYISDLFTPVSPTVASSADKVQDRMIPVYECWEADGVRMIGDIIEYTTIADWKIRIANDRPGLHHELNDDETQAYLVTIRDAQVEGE